MIPEKLTDALSASNSTALFSIDPSRDWPWGEGENDNYQNICKSCDKEYRGHKRSPVCKRCDTESRAAWDAMTPEQQSNLMEERAAIWKDFLENA